MNRRKSMVKPVDPHQLPDGPAEDVLGAPPPTGPTPVTRECGCLCVGSVFFCACSVCECACAHE